MAQAGGCSASGAMVHPPFCSLLVRQIKHLLPAPSLTVAARRQLLARQIQNLLPEIVAARRQLLVRRRQRGSKKQEAEAAAIVRKAEGDRKASSTIITATKTASHHANK